MKRENPTSIDTEAKTRRTYNGHRNRDYWNVSLWIGNDYGLYCMARDYVREIGNRRQAARTMLESLNECGIYETPDGSKYNVSRIYEAMEGLS